MIHENICSLQVGLKYTKIIESGDEKIHKMVKRKFNNDSLDEQVFVQFIWTVTVYV